MLKHVGTVRLESKRLILRQFREEDAADMYENWASDPEVTKYLTWPAHGSIDISQKIIKLWMDNYVNPEHYEWGIELKDNGKLLGSISILNIDNHNESCEIGYCLSRSYWGNGIATEALGLIIHLGFREIGFERIGARHQVENPASGRVMEKCGLKYEGTLRKISKNGFGKLVDCKYYSILKDEYTK